MRTLFGNCIFDVEARELRRGGRLVPLSPKVFELLCLLLESRPKPLTQGELRDALWPDTHVGYTSLARVVAEARKVIGDTARPPSLVRTVPRFGYAFAGPVVIEAGPRLPEHASAFVSRDREFALPEGETLVGRGSECGVRLAAAQVSRLHARVRVEGGTATLEDLGSKNGTWINGTRLDGRAVLDDGHEVIFGTFRVVYRAGGPPGSTDTGRPADD